MGEDHLAPDTVELELGLALLEDATAIRVVPELLHRFTGICARAFHLALAEALADRGHTWNVDVLHPVDLDYLRRQRPQVLRQAIDKVLRRGEMAVRGDHPEVQSRGHELVVPSA